MSWENLLIPDANNKGADQPMHPRSLISTFVVRCLDSIISPVSISENFKPLASLCSLTWWKTLKTGFPMTWLNYHPPYLFLCTKWNWTYQGRTEEDRQYLTLNFSPSARDYWRCYSTCELTGVCPSRDPVSVSYFVAGTGTSLGETWWFLAELDSPTSSMRRGSQYHWGSQYLVS